MKKIILISCVSKKLATKAKAKNLYISPLFKYNIKYVQTFNADLIFILSAKYGLLDTEREIEPYEVTLNNMKTLEIKAWSEIVLRQLSEVTDLEKDEFTFLAGLKYRKFLLPHIKNYQIPLEGLPIGKQLQFLKNYLNER